MGLIKTNRKVILLAIVSSTSEKEDIHMKVMGYMLTGLIYQQACWEETVAPGLLFANFILKMLC